jgi:hypothetical protein
MSERLLDLLAAFTVLAGCTGAARARIALLGPLVARQACALSIVAEHAATGSTRPSRVRRRSMMILVCARVSTGNLLRLRLSLEIVDPVLHQHDITSLDRLVGPLFRLQHEQSCAVRRDIVCPLDERGRL